MTRRQRVGAAIRAFWLAPASPMPSAVLRLAVASLCLIQLAALWNHLLILYGNHGFIQWAVVEASNDAWVPSIGKLALVLSDWGVASATTVYAVFGIYGACLVGLVIGYRTKLFVVLTWLGHTVTLNSGFFSLYGVDTMLHILLFYLLFAPAGAWGAVDARLGRVSTAPSAMARVAQRLIQLHLCIIYLNTGLAKASGDQWWNGEAIWRSVMQPQFNAFEFSWLAAHPALAMVAGWSVLVVEAGYCVLVWIPALRRPMVMAAIAMHIGIAVTMNLWLFSATMVAFNLAAFWWGRSPAPASARAASRAGDGLGLAVVPGHGA